MVNFLCDINIDFLFRFQWKVYLDKPFNRDIQSRTISIRDCVRNTTSTMHNFDAES